ncbi:hypothetical protein QTP88_009412 [Uroleucon formosanum]
MAMFIKSKRYKDMVAFNKFKYNFASKNVSTDEIRWRCVKRTCSATLYTSNSKVTETYIKMNSIEIPQKTKYKKMKERQEFNKKLILLYRSVEITRYEFVKSIRILECITRLGSHGRAYTRGSESPNARLTFMIIDMDARQVRNIFVYTTISAI